MVSDLFPNLKSLSFNQLVLFFTVSIVSNKKVQHVGPDVPLKSETSFLQRTQLLFQRLFIANTRQVQHPICPLSGPQAADIVLL